MDAYPILTPFSGTSDFNGMNHVIQQAHDARMTCMICMVKKVSTSGGIAAIGTVDVQPLVKMVDGQQQGTSHDTVHGLPYVRMMGGKFAVILDPQVNDIGIVISADRDISTVKQTMKESPPGSARSNNIADGIFIGMCLSQKPTSYVRFDSNGNIELSPDGGKTAVWVQPSRIDLGMKNAPHAVVTVDGPSTKVFAVISESGSSD
jgi:hypothetical protein